MKNIIHGLQPTKNLFNFSKNFQDRKKSQSGFIIADFLFSFVLVIGIGIFIFALTFSLATIEISQYIVWSSARAYSAANTDTGTASNLANSKFKKLSAQFPLLTGEGEASPWFKLDDFKAQDHQSETNFLSKVTDSNDRLNRDGNLENRQPWIGASANIYLKLFASMKIPFIGKVSDNPETTFKFRVYAFVMRSPSFTECTKFFTNRFTQGIQTIDSTLFQGVGTNIPDLIVEDNGC